jgi:hypothetical protein
MCFDNELSTFAISRHATRAAHCTHRLSGAGRKETVALAATFAATLLMEHKAHCQPDIFWAHFPRTVVAAVKPGGD